jgi:hypothetical protein
MHAVAVTAFVIESSQNIVSDDIGAPARSRLPNAPS